MDKRGKGTEGGREGGREGRVGREEGRRGIGERGERGRDKVVESVFRVCTWE